MNTITVNFVPCEPTPANGYNIQWRVAGSTDPFTDAGNFTESPAVFEDETNPDGTDYEGFIRSDCCESGSGESGENCFGNEIAWTTVVESGSGGEVQESIVEVLPCVTTGRIISISFDNDANFYIHTGGSVLPLTSGQSMSIVPELGTGTLRVLVDGLAGSIRVTDSNGIVQCLNYAGADTYEFPGFVIFTEPISIVLDCDPC